MALFGSKQKGRFHFELPGEWEDQTVYYFRGPVEKGVEHTLMMTIDRHLQDDDIEDFARVRINAVEGSFPGMETMIDEEITVPGGIPAYEYTYKWIPSEDMKFVEKYVFAFKNGMGFTFYIRFEKNTHKTVGMQLAKVIESLLPGVYKPVEE